MSLDNYLTPKQKELFIKDHTFIEINSDYWEIYKCYECDLHILHTLRIHHYLYVFYNKFNYKRIHPIYSTLSLKYFANFVYDLSEDKILKQRRDYIVLSHNEQMIKNIIE